MNALRHLPMTALIFATALAPLAPRAADDEAAASPASSEGGATAGSASSASDESTSAKVKHGLKKATGAVDKAAHEGADALRSGTSKAAKAVDRAAHQGAEKLTGPDAPGSGK